jgi:tRNA/tmRNA/rRNA uracil-C5-methylase (TrmA/RlmC/RlmD family)
MDSAIMSWTECTGNKVHWSAYCGNGDIGLTCSVVPNVKAFLKELSSFELSKKTMRAEVSNVSILFMHSLH